MALAFEAGVCCHASGLSRCASRKVGGTVDRQIDPFM